MSDAPPIGLERGEDRFVPLERLPGIPSIARALSAGNAAPFLPDRPDLATIAERARLALSRFAPRRANVAPGLEDLAAGRRAGVFTGQQVGLFTGPLLALTKAVATLKLAEEIERAGVPAAPVFWCASEDHDLVEVTRCVLPSPDGPHDAGPDPAALGGNRRPVGNLPIELDVDGLLEKAAAAAGHRDPAALEALRVRNAGRTYLEAFVATLGWMLEGSPLGMVDGARLEDKPELVPLAVRFIRERADVRRILEERAKALVAAGHTLQVTGDPHALPLFVIAGGERWLLREAGSRLELKGHPEDRAWETEEVVAELESGRFVPSFSALSRPLTVSHLYPVAATILGPAEVAYWAQAHPLFAWAGLVAPVLVPRPMLAVVDPGTRRLVQKFGLTFENVLAGPEEILKARGARSAAGVLARLDAVRAAAVSGLEALRPELAGIDESLGKAIDTTREKVEFALQKLEEKSAAAAGRSQETLARQVERVASALVPGGTLAERVYTPVTYLLTLGREGLVGPILRELKWDRAGLQVVDA